jgi:hypothetical protein
MQEFTQKWQEQVDFLKNELKGAQDKIRHERTLAKDELIHQNNAIRSLKQKLVTATKKNEILSTLVDQQRKSAEVQKINQYIYSTMKSNVLLACGRKTRALLNQIGPLH